MPDTTPDQVIAYARNVSVGQLRLLAQVRDLMTLIARGAIVPAAAAAALAAQCDAQLGPLAASINAMDQVRARLVTPGPARVM